MYHTFPLSMDVYCPKTPSRSSVIQVELSEFLFIFTRLANEDEDQSQLNRILSPNPTPWKKIDSSRVVMRKSCTCSRITPTEGERREMENTGPKPVYQLQKNTIREKEQWLKITSLVSGLESLMTFPRLRNSKVVIKRNNCGNSNIYLIPPPLYTTHNIHNNLQLITDNTIITILQIRKNEALCG